MAYYKNKQEINIKLAPITVDCLKFRKHSFETIQH